MTRIEVSLARTHKIAERLKTRAAEFFKDAQAQGQVAHINGTTGDAHIQRLTQQGSQALALSSRGERYLRAAATVRAAIGRENQARGINDLLAQLDAVNRVLAHKKELLEQAKADGIEPSELAGYKPLTGNEARYGGIAINVLGESARTELSSAISTLQREAFQLSDRIAEANAARLALELDEDIAGEVTGG